MPGQASLHGGGLGFCQGYTTAFEKPSPKTEIIQEKEEGVSYWTVGHNKANSFPSEALENMFHPWLAPEARSMPGRHGDSVNQVLRMFKAILSYTVDFSKEQTPF